MAGIGAVTEMDLLDAAAAGMRTDRTVLDLAARNVAAAQASTPDHGYRRLVAQFAPASAVTDIDGGSESLSDDENADDASGPASIVGVRSEPGTGDALAEMIAVLDAQRAYEQHASIFDIGKRLAERTIDLGRS